MHVLETISIFATFLRIMAAAFLPVCLTFQASQHRSGSYKLWVVMSVSAYWLVILETDKLLGEHKSLSQALHVMN